ncbi:hypothetical protein KCU65_g5166, partial [Aureobasidium melanogenum]
MAAAAAEAQRLREAINNLQVGSKPPRNFPGSLSAPTLPSSITLDERQKQRFIRNKFLAEVAGVTTAGAIVGGCQVVIAKAGETEVNFYCLSEGPERMLEMVDRDHVTFIHQDTNLRAWDRLSQVNALTSAETAGLITHAEADMAARHIGAYKAALRVCQRNGLYESDQISSTLKSVIARTDADSLLQRFNDHYDADVGRDVFAHAISFYNTHRLEFPQQFDEDQHMDWFIVWYRDQVWNATLQRIDIIEPRTMIANVGRMLRGQRSSNLVLHSQIVGRANLDAARWTSEIAMNDARPAIYAGDASRSSPWEDLQRSGFIDPEESNEDKLKFVFWNDHQPPGLVEPNKIRPCVLTLIRPRAARAIIQYREYERSFEQWSEDVVAFLVFKEMRVAAEQVNIAMMAEQFRRVRHMMEGRRARNLSNDDSSESEDSDDSNNSNDSDDSNNSNDSDGSEDGSVGYSEADYREY